MTRANPAPNPRRTSPLSGATAPGVGNVPVEVYDDLYRMFTLVKCDRDPWVRIAKNAGIGNLA
jgi:hypothetical protein